MKKISDYIEYNIEVEINDFYDTNYVKKVFGIDDDKNNALEQQIDDNLVVKSNKYDYICPLDYGVHIALKGNKWGCLDENGKVIVPFKYNIINPFDAGLTIVKKGKKHGIIDTRGKQIIPCTYDYIDDFSIGYAAVKKNGKWGYVNMKGYAFIEPKYDSADRFKFGYARVGMRDHFGIINRYKEIIPCIYEDIDVIGDGLFKIKEFGKYGVIDTFGNHITECIYDNIYEFNGDKAIVQMFDLFGLTNKSGKPIISCVYDNVRCLDNDLMLITKGKKSAVVDEKNVMPITVNDTILAKDKEDFMAKYAHKYHDYDCKLKYLNTKYMSIIEMNDNYIFISANNEEDLAYEKEEIKNTYRDSVNKKLTNDLSIFDDSISGNLSDSYQKTLRRKND